MSVSVCVCVCERERERERVCVLVALGIAISRQRAPLRYTHPHPHPHTRVHTHPHTQAHTMREAALDASGMWYGAPQRKSGSQVWPHTYWGSPPIHKHTYIIRASHGSASHYLVTRNPWSPPPFPSARCPHIDRGRLHRIPQGSHVPRSREWCVQACRAPVE